MKDQFTVDGIVVENAIGFWIQRVFQATRTDMYRAFREHGEDITPEQWAVLIRLWERDARTQSELTDATFRDRPTMSRILDVMEKHALVERHVDPQDSRARIVRLTRRGRGLQKKLVPVARSLVAKLSAGIDDDALETTRDTLRRMFANLSPTD